MKFNEWNQDIKSYIETSIESYLPIHQFSEVIKYSVFPTGKLFRPTLVYCMAHDLGDLTDDHKLAAMAIELHHTYTLIHDDLPAMDDDDYRRGRLASHKKFTEWEAILAGDALMNNSYEILAEITPKFLPKILKYFAEATGAKGLILGQVKDLAGEDLTLEDILEIHRLKTGELIALCLTIPCIISNKEDEMLRTIKNLGYAIGENFQILDDLCELTEDINKHEKEVNPFLKFPAQESISKLKQNAELIQSICVENKLKHLMEYNSLYTAKMKSKVIASLDKVNEYIKLDSSELDRL